MNRVLNLNNVHDKVIAVDLVQFRVSKDYTICLNTIIFISMHIYNTLPYKLNMSYHNCQNPKTFRKVAMAFFTDFPK